LISAAPARPLALTLGDPSGVGPEIIIKAWRVLKSDGPAFMVVGDHDALTAAPGADKSTPVVRVGRPEEALEAFSEAVPVLDLPLSAPVIAGQPSAIHAPSIIRWIETGAGLALGGRVSGLVTAPIAKAPLYQAGFRFPGHTEFLAELTLGSAGGGGVGRGPVMMLAAKDVRAALVTIHLSLAEAVRSITAEAVISTGLVTSKGLTSDFGIRRPRLALAALNPHAGEDGALGREEIEILNPAAAALRALGVSCTDARPADTLFHEAARETFDGVICLYHDQALIPLKTIDFWGGVNVTLGLPIVRTSPDHGTGFDIAGRGLARADSLIAAIRMAGDIAGRREAAQPQIA
jgi:4-hydroxythreonine-4-phosphate dehydrogenase